MLKKLIMQRIGRFAESIVKFYGIDRFSRIMGEKKYQKKGLR